MTETVIADAVRFAVAGVLNTLLTSAVYIAALPRTRIYHKP
ncbi:MAG: hypothetical protein ACRESZ_16715 [Methylococcales bacterium]